MTHRRPLVALLLAALPLAAQSQAPVTRYEYDANGNRSALIDPLGRRTGNAWDALNRLSRTTDAAGGVIAYGYDGLDRLTRVSDPRNLATAYTYNGLGDLISLASPDTGTTQHSYDAAGNLLSRSDAKGQTTSYRYDALNRVTRIAYADGQVTLYTYDQGSNGVGRLGSIAHTFPAGHPFAGQLLLAFTYDARGRLLAETQTLPDGATARVAWDYDAAGRLVTLTYPSGRQVSRSYDAAGRVSEVRVSAGGQSQVVATGIAYRPFGAAAAHTWGNATPYARGFDAEGRQASYPLGAGSRLLTHDAASNILTQTDSANPAATVGYAYDALNRLTGQTEPGLLRTWSYDAVGNRLSDSLNAATTPYQVGATSNRLTQVGSQGVVSDANGAITADGIRTYTYDARGRLVSSQGPGGSVHHLIDPLGRRLMKRGSLGGTRFAYDEAGHLIAEHDAAGGAARLEHLWANDVPLAVAVPQPGGAAEIVLDNGSAAFSVTGTWPVSTAVAGFHGANYQTHAGATTPPGIVVDNGSAGFAVTGTWSASTAVAGFHGTNYLHHFADADPVGTRVVDNPQGSASGTWAASTAVAGYVGSNYQTHPAAGGSDAFTWTATLEPGTYDVYARWTAHPNRASNAQYAIGHAGGQAVVAANQQQDGGTWNRLGRYAFGSTATVSLAGAGNGYVVADAIRFVPAAGAPPTATWTATLEPGTYDVYARWTAHPNRARNAQYAIGHAGGQALVTANQQQDGGTWNRLGRYAFGGTATVGLTSAADGYVVADAMRFVAPDSAFETARWTPATAGTYDVYARWTAHPNRASNARYTVFHAAGQETLTVDQRQSGAAWVRLGNYALTGPSHRIELSSAADGYVVADAIRLLASQSNQPALLHYVHTDHLGTPRAVVTQQGTPLWRWDGEAFGATLASEDADGDSSPLEYNLRFPGQYFDRETNLNYNLNRYFDPLSGRYTTADPLGLNGGDLSLYIYAKNNPLSNIDPLGLFSGKVHNAITSEALAIAGATCTRLPVDVAMADWLPGSQDPQNSHWHAMRDGTNRNETPAAAESRYRNFVESQMRTCSCAGLARALHAVQDSFARGHSGNQPWGGGLPSYDHFDGDRNPSSEERAGAVNASVQLLKRFQRECTTCP